MLCGFLSRAALCRAGAERKLRLPQKNSFSLSNEIRVDSVVKIDLARARDDVKTLRRGRALVGVRAELDGLKASRRQ
jgi:hypothetical protein